MQKWRAQDKPMEGRMNEWKVNRLRRKGIAGVTVVKDRDTKAVQVWVPPGPQIPSLNKADRLCRRVAATLFSDPGVPEALPAGDDDTDRESAEFTTRALTDLGSESQLDDHGTNRKAFDLASTYGSGFRHYWIDAAGNGSRPMQVNVNANVIDVQTAVTDPGEEPYVTKYVKEDGTLADEDGEGVKRQWLPKLMSETLTGKHVRFVPPTASDIWKAQGVMIGSIRTLGDLKRIYPDEIGKLTDEQLKKLVSERPKTWRDLMPAGVRHAPERWGSERGTNDDSLCFYVTLYIKQSKRTPDGVFFVAGGDGIFLAKGAWKSDDDQELLVPVTQFKQYEDEDDGYGRGLMNLLGDGNEIRGALIGYFLEHLDRFSNRKIFMPQHSGISVKELQSATGWAVEVRGGPGGFPVTEEVPDFPRAGEKMTEFVTTEMDDESSLQQAGQGLEDGKVKSGIHAQRIIEQALTGLSDVRENAIKATIRGWRISLQLVRTHYTVPQMVGWVGDDGQHRMKEWSKTDLGSTKDVQMMRGTFTSMTASAKAATVQAMAEMQAITPQETRRMIMGGVGAVIGLQDDPHRQRARRQVSRWNDGPPDELEAQMQQLTQQIIPGQEEALQQQVQQLVAPALLDIFDDRTVDAEPEVAVLRAEELGNAMASTRYGRWPEWWQMGLTQAYDLARQAAGIVTIAEQQQAAQQEADQAAQQEEAARQQQEDTELAKLETQTAERELEAATRLAVARQPEPAHA